MGTDDPYELWAEEAAVLGQIGRALFVQPTSVTVRLPEELGMKALRIWQREGVDGELPPSETPEQRTIRHRAGTLSLIGRAIEQRGRKEGDGFVVDLDAWHVGNALEAADDMDLLRGLMPPSSSGHEPNSE